MSQETNRKRKKIFIFEIGLVLIIVLSATSATVLGFTVKKQGGTVHNSNSIPHNYECPSVNAVVAQIMDKVDMPDIRAFIAYLMELAVKKKVLIEDYQKDGTTFYRITLKDMHLISQDPLLAALFNDIGNGQTVTTEEIKNSRGKKVSQKVNRCYIDWRIKSYNEVVNQGLLAEKLIHKRNTNQTIICSLLFLSFGGALIFFFKFSEFRIIMLVVETILLFFGINALVHSNNMISFYSQKGAEITNQIRGFKHMLEDIGSFEMRDVGDLVLWEDIMPYAVTFDLAKKVLKELKIEFTTDEWQQSDFYIHEPIYNFNSKGFYESFNSSLGSACSIGGTSGDFSSGTSGGFSAGSGGGAF